MSSSVDNTVPGSMADARGSNCRAHGNAPLQPTPEQADGDGIHLRAAVQATESAPPSPSHELPSDDALTPAIVGADRDPPSTRERPATPSPTISALAVQRWVDGVGHFNRCPPLVPIAVAVASSRLRASRCCRSIPAIRGRRSSFRLTKSPQMLQSNVCPGGPSVGQPHSAAGELHGMLRDCKGLSNFR
jgi:hypothetical protein